MDYCESPAPHDHQTIVCEYHDRSGDDGTRHDVELRPKPYVIFDWLDVGTHDDAWQRAHARLLGVLIIGIILLIRTSSGKASNIEVPAGR
jgi:hypothetical protein